MKLGVLPLVFVLLTAFLSGCGPKEQSFPNAPGAGTGQVQPGRGQDTENQHGAVKSIDGLLQGLPKVKQPKPGPEGTIERNEAKGWLTKNVVGKTMEFSLRVEAVEAEPSGGGKYNVELQFLPNADRGEAKKLRANVIIGSLKIGGTSCQVQVWGPEPLWPDLDSATAKKRRELKGKQVLLSGKVTEAEFLEGDDDKQLLLMIGLDEVKLVRAEEPQWVKVEMPEGPCSAFFPSEPVRVVRPGTADFIQTTAYEHQLADGAGTYLISIAQPTPAQLKRIPRPDDIPFQLNGCRDRLVALAGGKLVRETKIKLGNRPGLDFVYTAPPGGTIRSRVFCINGRLYQAGVASTTDEAVVTSAAAEKFLASLTLPPE